MEKFERDNLIMELVRENKPRYVPDYENFKPGDQILYSGPWFDHNEIEAAIKALLSTKWISNGEYTARFQAAFARKFGVKEAHFVNSGSSANLLMIAALKKKLGWKDGDRVIVSPVGFPTTIAPLIQNGLVPIFVDIELNTLNFDINKFWDILPTSKKDHDRDPLPVVAIFVSPVLGNPPDLDRLKNISDSLGIKLIGDNCDSLGSRWNEKNITDYYYAWTTSFYVAHHMSTMEGGMVCSNDKELIETVRSLSWWGRDCHCVGSANLLACGTCGNRFDTHLGEEFGIVDHKYVFTNVGYNLKPLDIQAAIGLEQLKKFDEIERLRRKNFYIFSGLLKKYVNDIDVAWNLPEADPSWFGVPIICSTAEQKNKLVTFLETNKIQTRNYFAGNLLCHPAYRHLADYKEFPNANAALSHVFFVGCPPHYNQKVFDYIEEVLRRWT
jgi:CDP-4-dehydro-6-deoxyglucose reductase, E1